MIILYKTQVPTEAANYLDHLKESNGGFLETNNCIYYPNGIEDDSLIVEYKELPNGKYTQQRI